MSETTTTTEGAAQPTSADGLPAEVSAKIHDVLEEIKELSGKDALRQWAENNGLWEGLNINSVDDGTEGWMRKKLKRAAQAKVMKDAGIEPSAAVRAEDAKVDKLNVTGDEDGGEKKAGRRRMNTSGKYKVVLAEGQGGGRAGSYKGKIVAALKDKESFNYEEFTEAVKASYGFGTENEGETNFKDLATAASAWFSELKNKQGIVVEVIG